jgi:hypothetical protein
MMATAIDDDDDGTGLCYFRCISTHTDSRTYTRSGTFKDTNGVVSSIEMCAKIATEQRWRGFCISEGAQCLTSAKFFFQVCIHIRECLLVCMYIQACVCKPIHL